MNIKSIPSFNIHNIFAAKNLTLNKFSYPNLMPLPKDTLTFSGRSELLAENMIDAPQVKTCKEVEQNAVGASYYLYSVLDKYLSGILDFKENDTTKNVLKIKHKPAVGNKKDKIGTYELRIKSRSSIREKVVSKYAKMYKAEHNQFANQMLTLLEKYFPIRDGVDRKYVIDSIKRSTKHSSDSKTAAFFHVDHNVKTAVSNLQYLNYLDFGGASEEKINQVIEDVSAILSTRPSELIVDGKHMEPKSKAGVKYFANDVVGARIVLQDGDHSSTDRVISALRKAVEDGVLKITSIENNIPSQEKLPLGKSSDDYSYASQKSLRLLKNASEAELITNESKTGYMSIHINVDLSSPLFKNYGGVFNGYTGEIQIIGRDVEQLKQVEDLCYKFKDKKNAVNIAYKPFKDYFLKYYQGDVVKAFDDYTYALYLAQREKTPRRRATVFPTITELGFAGKVPPQLDFNKLKTIYEGCKSIAESGDIDTSKPKKSEKEIIDEGNFKTIKRLIDNKINPN